MAITNGPNLGLMIDGALGDPHYAEFMKLLRWMDGMLMGSAVSATITAEPGAPTNGQVYLLPNTPTGTDWAGNGNKLARYETTNSEWEFLTPKEGWEIYVADTNSRWRHDGTNWKFLNGSGTTGNRPAVGDSVLGAQYFDTTLGYPIWNDNTNWIDATGTTA